MGKNLVITGADFYDNALERSENWTDITSLFSSWVSGGWVFNAQTSSSGVFKRTPRVNISAYAGKRIKFSNVAWTPSDGTITGFVSIVFNASNQPLQYIVLPRNGAASSGYVFEDIITIDANATQIAFTYLTDAKIEALDQPSFYCFVEE